MLNKYGCIAVVLILTLPTYVSANDDPFTCSELGVFARGLTVARDQGTSLSRVEQIISEDGSFTATDKVAFKKVARTIFQSRSIDPDAMAEIARKECIKTGKRRP
jgi:hypothetical protein